MGDRSGGILEEPRSGEDDVGASVAGCVGAVGVDVRAEPDDPRSRHGRAQRSDQRAVTREVDHDDVRVGASVDVARERDVGDRERELAPVHEVADERDDLHRNAFTESRVGSTFFGSEVLREVVVLAELLDERDLGLEPVDRLVARGDHRFEHDAGALIAFLAAELDRLCEAFAL